MSGGKFCWRDKSSGQEDWIRVWTNCLKRWRVNSNLNSAETGKLDGESPSFILTNIFLEMLKIQLAWEIDQFTFFLRSHTAVSSIFMILCMCFDIFLFLFPIFSQELLPTTKCNDGKHTFVQDRIRCGLHFCFTLPKVELFFLLRCFQLQNWGKGEGGPHTENVCSGWLKFTFIFRARKFETKTNCNAFDYCGKKWAFLCWNYKIVYRKKSYLISNSLSKS